MSSHPEGIVRDAEHALVDRRGGVGLQFIADASERRVDVERARARRVDLPRVVPVGAVCAAMTLVVAMELSPVSLWLGVPVRRLDARAGDMARMLPTCVRRRRTVWTISRPPQRLAAGLSRSAITQFA
jgi:hypothetical protein